MALKNSAHSNFLRSAVKGRTRVSTSTAQLRLCELSPLKKPGVSYFNNRPLVNNVVNIRRRTKVCWQRQTKATRSEARCKTAGFIVPLEISSIVKLWNHGGAICRHIFYAVYYTFGTETNPRPSR